MGWNQWALLRFANKSVAHTLKLKFPDTGKHWGYPFDAGNMHDRYKLDYEKIENQEILPNTTYTYGHTGKQNEWAGMEGTVEAFVKQDGGSLGDKVCKIFYACPWSGKNQFYISDVKAGWKVDHWGSDVNGGALGSITVDLRKV